VNSILGAVNSRYGRLDRLPFVCFVSFTLRSDLQRPRYLSCDPVAGSGVRSCVSALYLWRPYVNFSPVCLLKLAELFARHRVRFAHPVGRPDFDRYCIAVSRQQIDIALADHAIDADAMTNAPSAERAVSSHSSPEHSAADKP